MSRVLRIACIFLLIAAAPVWADCQLAKVGGIEPLFAGNRIYLHAMVNDKPVLFVVGLGSNTGLFSGPAEKAGVRITGDTRRDSYGLTGQAMIDSRAVVDKLQIGHWKAENVPLRAIGPIEPYDVEGLPVVGHIGDDLLSHFDVEISVKDRLLALYQPLGCDGASLAYWSPEYNVVDIIRYTEQAPRVRVQAKLDGRTIAVLLGTGSPYSMVSQDIAASLDVTADSPGTQPAGMVTGIHGQPAQSWVGIFKSFELDQEKIAPAKIDFFVYNRRDFNGASRTAAQVFDVDMILGLDFISAHHVLISYSQQKVYFSYAGGKPFNAPKPQDALIDPNK